MRTRIVAAALVLASVAHHAAAGDPPAQPVRFATDGRMSKIAVSPDGKLVYVGGFDGVVHVCDAADGKQVGRLAGDSRVVVFLDFPGADPSTVVSAALRESACTWDAASCALRRRFEIPGDPPPDETTRDGGFVPTQAREFAVAVAARKDLLAIANPDHRVLLWHPAADRTAGDLPFEGSAYAASLSADGTRLALSVGGLPGKRQRIEVRGVATGAALWKDAVGDDDAVVGARGLTWAGLRFSPDGRCLLASACSWTERSSSGGLRCYDAATGARIWSRTFSDRGVLSVAYAPDGARIAVSTVHGLSMFDAATGVEVGTIGTAADAQLDVAFSPDGRRLYGTLRGGGGWIRWDVDADVRPVEIPAVTSATGPGVEGALAATPTPIETKEQTESIAVSPDGKWLAAAEKSAVRVYDLAAGTLKQEFVGHKLDVESVAFVGGDSDCIVSHSSGRDPAIVWSITTGRSRASIGDRQSHSSTEPVPASWSITCVAACPSRREIAVGFRTGTTADGAGPTVGRLMIVDGASNWSAHVVPLPAGTTPTRVAFSDDGLHVAATLSDDAVGLLVAYERVDAKSPWTKDWEWRLGLDNVMWDELCYAHDGVRLLGAGRNLPTPRPGALQPATKFRRVSWQAGLDSPAWEESDDRTTVGPVASPRSDGVAFACLGDVRIVDPATGRTSGRPMWSERGCRTLAFSADGRRLYAATQNRRIVFWDLGDAK